MRPNEGDRQRSVAQVNRMVRSIIEAETLEQFFWVGGRIDRFHKSERGHIYFDLVDGHSRIRCMLREEQSGRFPLDLRNHLDIEVYGDVQVYEERAEAQIIVVDLRLADASADAMPAVDRLRAEKLYPPAKKAAPARIRRIGIVTSRSSRAIGDFENTYRSAGERQVLAPASWKYVVLEGERAAQSIVDAIVALDAQADIDAIAIIRGGGRSENLAVFDTYEIARALVQCGAYTVTGIGHHRDSTLADDVADFSASTPTAAAHHLAEICLRSVPSRAAAAPPVDYPADDWAPDLEAEDFGFLPPEDAPVAEAPPPPPPPRRSRTMDVVIVVLLATAIAAVLFLIAVVISQMP